LTVLNFLQLSHDFLSGLSAFLIFHYQLAAKLQFSQLAGGLLQIAAGGG